jgi:hypothetical protein
MPMRRGYVIPMRWMVIYEYGVPGGALNLNSTNYPEHGHHRDPPLSRKNPHGRARNRTRDLMISSQAGHILKLKTVKMLKLYSAQSYSL